MYNLLTCFAGVMILVLTWTLIHMVFARLFPLEATKLMVGIILAARILTKVNPLHKVVVLPVAILVHQTIEFEMDGCYDALQRR